MLKWLMSRLNIWVWLGGLFGAILLTLLFGIVIMYLVPVTQAAQTTPIQVTRIVLNTPTPTVEIQETTRTPQPVQQPKGININGYVQIIDTGNVGLNIRSGPGVIYDKKFLGLEGEVFQVVGGPVEADGYTWWQLEAPYDSDRSGWAVESYLKEFEK